MKGIHIDPRIAEYIKALRLYDPWVNSTSAILSRLYCTHGVELVDDLLRKHWEAIRAAQADADSHLVT